MMVLVFNKPRHYILAAYYRFGIQEQYKKGLKLLYQKTKFLTLKSTEQVTLLLNYFSNYQQRP